MAPSLYFNAPFPLIGSLVLLLITSLVFVPILPEAEIYYCYEN